MRRETWRVTGLRWLKFNLVGGIGIAVHLLILVVLKTGSKIGRLMPGFPMVRLDSRGFGVFGSFAKCGLA
jgi:hypothetical protein